MIETVEDMVVEDVEVPKSLGICSTCNHLNNCIHRLKTNHPIWFCEEFDDYTPSDIAAVIANPDIELSDNGRGEFMGLCINCENRFECPHAKQAGGVWQCEEYR